MDASAAAILAVNARDAEETRVALLAGGRLHDLRWTRSVRGSLVGSVHLGVVTRVEEGLDAVFVDVGQGRAGFLHVGQTHPALADAGLDPVTAALQPAPREAGARELLGAEAEEASGGPAAPTAPRIGTLLQPGRRLLVQVLRDPVRQKGVTLTTFVSLAGHRLVYMPSLGRPGASRRLSDPAERERLRALLADFAGADCGLIARTAAEGCDAAQLAPEWEALRERWRAMAARCRHSSAPAEVLAEEPAIVRAARELLTTDVARVIVDDARAADELRAALLAAGLTTPVEAWTQSRPLFEALDVEREWQGLFRPRVSLPGGASIVIHETEALTAVDVNSGSAGAGSLEETALATNLAAAEELARQVRLRDLGGIVVVDFIDMQRVENRRRVEAALRNALMRDRARLKTGHLGAFGLMAFTRRRVGAGLPRAVEALCRGCGGAGHVAHHHAGALRAVRRMRAEPAARAFRVRAQPGTCAALRGPLADAVRDLGRPVDLVEDLQVSAADPVVQPDLLAGPPERG